MAELAPGEELVWWERPDPARYARRGYPRTIFGLFFTAFALFWEFQVLGAVGEGGVPVFMALFGLPFIAVGLGMVFQPFWLRWKAQRLLYVLTDRRIVIIDRSPFGSVASYGPQDIGHLSRRERKDGSGDLIFREEVSTHHARGLRRTRRKRIGLFAIPEVRKVERAVAGLKAGRHPASDDLPMPPAPKPTEGRTPGGER